MSTSGLDLYTDVLDDPVELDMEDVSYTCDGVSI